MSSNWGSEIRAVMRKEWRTEARSKSGWMTAGLLGVGTVFSVAFATFGQTLSGPVAAGLLWAALLFVAVGTLGRSYLLEEEQGTADLLRVLAHPLSVFWGKALFAWLQMAFASLLLSVLFVVLTGAVVKNWDILAISLIGGSAALACTVTFCSALIARGSNRGSLVGVVAFPLLLPLIALGVAAGRVAFGIGMADGGWSAAAGLWLYAIASFAIHPHLAGLVWKEA